MTLALDDIDENFLRGFGFLDDQKLLRLFESILRTLKMLRHPKKFVFNGVLTEQVENNSYSLTSSCKMGFELRIGQIENKRSMKKIISVVNIF
jgi:hypothetical protein